MWLEDGANRCHAVPEPSKPHPLLGERVDTPDARTLVWEQSLGGRRTAYSATHCTRISFRFDVGDVEMMVTRGVRTLGRRHSSSSIWTLSMRYSAARPALSVQTVLTPAAQMDGGDSRSRRRLRTADGAALQGYRQTRRGQLRNGPRFGSPSTKRLSGKLRPKTRAGSGFNTAAFRGGSNGL